MANITQVDDEMLTAEQLKELSEFDPSDGYDSKYITRLMDMLFTRYIIWHSSCGGAPSNKNNRKHLPLDPKKTEFIKREYPTSIASNSFIFLVVLIHRFFKGMFEKRVRRDQERMKKFNYYVNKRCNNVRRAPKPPRLDQPKSE